MRLQYGELEAVLTSIHGPGAKPTAMLGRVKYLQRYGWPIGGAKGQGSRAGYGLAQVLGLCAALELMEMGMTPLRVLRLLRTSWPIALPAFLLGWESARSKGTPVWLAMMPHSLAELGVEEDHERPSPDRLRAVSPTELLKWLANAAAGARSIYVLNPVRLTADLIDALFTLKLATEEEAAKACLTLGTEIFGSSRPEDWSLDHVR